MERRDAIHDSQDLSGTFQSAKIEGFDHVESGTPVMYKWIYDRIFWDLDHAGAELSGPKVDFANLIHASAHLRLAIERIVTASFAASHRLFSDAQAHVETAKDFGEMRKRVKAINENYWPCAFGEVRHDGQRGIGVIPELGISEDAVGRHFGFLSSILHAPNPFREKKTNPDEAFAGLKELSAGLNALVTSHIVQLAGSSEFLYLRRDPEFGIRIQAIRTETPLL